MKIITRQGWFKPDGTLLDRLEPWTTPQEIADDLFDVLPSSIIIVTPPAGRQFKKGVKYSNGDFTPGVPYTGQSIGDDARWPTKKDVELIGVEVQKLPETEIEAEPATSEVARFVDGIEGITLQDVLDYKAAKAASEAPPEPIPDAPEPEPIPDVPTPVEAPEPAPEPASGVEDKVAKAKKRLRKK